MGDMTEAHTEVYKEGTNTAMYAGAIQYSDGIVLAAKILMQMC
jgi:starch synthase